MIDKALTPVRSRWFALAVAALSHCTDAGAGRERQCYIQQIVEQPEQMRGIADVAA
ncbi:hypothetical protein [Xanthomonas vesicatoria]|uniref:hypothetical protein n=1 Tax=Xanthomonas vesicatoria TaxID=56460 RepID=UPI000AC80502|nr:hypothetical protein [Xanthomonas vesicatoria]MCC8619244.1 hypothetical protein [Xanthomonas vesicatoria]MCC8681255.1 hypothetical protein [Xanthomonas vesicatoria]